MNSVCKADLWKGDGGDWDESGDLAEKKGESVGLGCKGPLYQREVL